MRTVMPSCGSMKENKMKLTLTPCIVCTKAVMNMSLHSKSLRCATSIIIKPSYPSDFEDHQYIAIICDACLEQAIQNNKVLIN